MKMIKFVSYFENGVLNVEFSEKYYPDEAKIPCHADICKKLQAKGIKSKDLVTAGTAVYKKDGVPLVVEQRYFNVVETEDVVSLMVMANREYPEQYNQVSLFNNHREK